MVNCLVVLDHENSPGSIWTNLLLSRNWGGVVEESSYSSEGRSIIVQTVRSTHLSLNKNQLRVTVSPVAMKREKRSNGHQANIRHIIDLQMVVRQPISRALQDGDFRKKRLFLHNKTFPEQDMFRCIEPTIVQSPGKRG